MGSNYFGERGVGLSSSSSSSQSSSRKGKKNASDKPKQPQRGLGVAQLEKIRLLHSQQGCNYPTSVPNPYHAPNLSQEDIRMQTAYPAPSSSSFAYSSSSTPYHGVQGPHGVMMGFQDLDRASPRYADISQSTNISRCYLENARTGSQQFVEPNVTRFFFESGDEGSLQHKQDQHDSRGLSTQNSESNTHEIDLELRLSL